MNIKKYNTTNFNTDSPNPTILPPNAAIYFGNELIPKNIAANRSVIQHQKTNRNFVSQTRTPASEQRVSAQSSTACNCGINTGHKYSFEVTYKKSDLLKNPNTNEIRRDWLYIQLIGNFDENSVKTDRFLIYLK